MEYDKKKMKINKDKWSGVRQDFVGNDTCPISEGKYTNLKVRERKRYEKTPTVAKS